MGRVEQQPTLRQVPGRLRARLGPDGRQSARARTGASAWASAWATATIATRLGEPSRVSAGTTRARGERASTLRLESTRAAAGTPAARAADTAAWATRTSRPTAIASTALPGPRVSSQTRAVVSSEVTAATARPARARRSSMSVTTGPRVALAGDDQRGARAEGGDDGAEARGGEPLRGVVQGHALGGEGGVEPVGRERRAQRAVARPGRQARPLGAAHGALHLRVARVAEGLGEAHDGRRAAVGGAGHLVGRQQRDVREVVGQVARERLLGRAEPVVVALEALGECVDIGRHGALVRRRAAFPYRRRALSEIGSPAVETILTDSTWRGSTSGRSRCRLALPPARIRGGGAPSRRSARPWAGTEGDSDARTLGIGTARPDIITATNRGVGTGAGPSLTTEAIATTGAPRPPRGSGARASRTAREAGSDPKRSTDAPSPAASRPTK